MIYSIIFYFKFRFSYLNISKQICTSRQNLVAQSAADATHLDFGVIIAQGAADATHLDFGVIIAQGAADATHLDLGVIIAQGAADEIGRAHV